MTMSLEEQLLHEAWYRVCREIIDRCVAPEMYGNAHDLLAAAMRHALNEHKKQHMEPVNVKQLDSFLHKRYNY